MCQSAKAASKTYQDRYLKELNDNKRVHNKKNAGDNEMRKKIQN